MIELIQKVNSAINSVVWGWPAMILILGVGLYLTLRTKGLQFSKFGYSMKHTFGKIFEKKEDASAGAITPFQAVCTALAGTVGTGNVAGVAGAICLGGPGAVFWMWVSALLGMCTKYSEVTLALKFREKNENGEWVGGPMYYIKNGLGKNWKWLAILFSIFGVCASFGTGNATQAGSIKDSINSTILAFGGQTNPTINLVIGIVCTALLLLVLIGGLKRLAKVTEKLVPFMAVLYVILGLGIIVTHLEKIPGIFGAIFKEAFTPRAAIGGGMFVAMKRGIARGIFSNEAGLGSAPMAHASADTKDPAQQGLYGIFEVFVDTIIVCTMTALIIMCAGNDPTWGVAAGAELTISSFTETYGAWAAAFGAVAICCFAFSTALGWGLYGSRCIEYLFGTKVVKPYIIIYSFISIIGTTLDLGLVWEIADTFNGLMAIPNLIALALLAPVLIKVTKEHFDKKNSLK